MQLTYPIRFLSLIIVALIAPVFPTMVSAFEGRISAALTRGAETNVLQYTVGAEQLRIEVTSTNWPNPVNILELKSGALTLVFPHNRSFVQLKSGTGVSPVPTDTAATGQAGSLSYIAPPPPSLPPGIGPTNFPGAPPMPNVSATPAMPPSVGPQPGGVGPGVAGMPAMPPMPMRPMGPEQKMELKATGQTTNILGFTCERYEVKQRGETLEVWATDKLMTFQPYLRNQPHRFGPRMIEEQWPGLLKERELFPLLVSLHYDNGAERLRFEVKSVKEEKINDHDGKLFQPPKDYHEMEPLPF